MTDRVPFAIVAAWVLFFAWLLSKPAYGAPIEGFDPAINYTGFDPTPNGFTFVPITNKPSNAANEFKPEYLDFFRRFLPVQVGRIMDLQHINDNAERTWPQRATHDFGPTGIRHETAVSIANQMRANVRADYVPWIHRPGLADRDYGVQMGRLWAQLYTGNKIRLADGNEKWAPFGTNVAAQAMVIARQQFPGVDDFTALSRYQGHRLGEFVRAFEEGWMSTGRPAPDLTMMVEGFVPVARYAELQIEQMAADGVPLAKYKPRIAVGMYAFGSATDANGYDLSTPAKKRDGTLAWIEANLKPWVAAHLALAIAKGLAPVVDAYEYRVMQKPVAAGSQEMVDWVNFQLLPENADGQERALRSLVPAAGGSDAAFAIEGVYGFPLDAPQGQFPLLPYDPAYLENPYLSAAFAGYRRTVDVDVPEPSAWAVAVVLAVMVWAGRKGRVA